MLMHWNFPYAIEIIQRKGDRLILTEIYIKLPQARILKKIKERKRKRKGIERYLEKAYILFIVFWTQQFILAASVFKET